ncbi:hypothetical protein [Streptomyces sp. NPDC019507]|uniref:hypothetical protein n=1 Tax=Streptomyces sp. NPDC019507 TaxID=3154689 RepID=UPI0033DA7E03
MARDDRCQVARAVHYGGPEMKAHARDKPAASDADLRQVVADRSFGTLAQARAQGRDKEAASPTGPRTRNARPS